MIERNADFFHIIWWSWFSNTCPIHPQIRKITLPGILHHTQQGALRGKPSGDRLANKQAFTLDDACRVLSEYGWKRSIGKVHAKHFPPEIDIGANARSRRELIDTLQDKVLGFVFAAHALQFGVVSVQQSGQMFWLYLFDDVVGQAGEQLGQTQADHTTVVPNVPGQFTGIRSSPVDHQRGRWARLSSIPGNAITLLKLCTKHKRVFVQHQFEATATQFRQQLFIQQNIIRIASNPEPI